MIDVTSPAVAIVELDAAADTASFTKYLRRLGCTVSATSNGQIRALITYPETVEEEEQALWAWCDQWARRHAVAIQLSFEAATSGVVFAQAGSPSQRWDSNSRSGASRVGP